MAKRNIIKPKIQLAKITIIKIGFVCCLARVLFGFDSFRAFRFILFVQIALTNCAAENTKWFA